MQYSAVSHTAERRPRNVIGTLAIVLGAIIATLGISAGPSLAYTGPEKIASTAASNQASHWGTGCTKLDEPGERSWEADADYGIVVLKAAQWDFVFYDVVKGDVLTVEDNDISHFIFCPPTTTTTTTSIPKETTTTTTIPKETTTTTSTTTTTIPKETTTTTTTTSTTTTTIPEETTTTTSTTTTTIPEETTTTTTSVPEETTTTTTVPDEETTTTTVPDEETTTTTVPDEEATTTTQVGQAGPTTTAASGAGGTTTVSAELPQTGTDGGAKMLVLGGLLVLFGAVLLLTSRRPATI